MNQDNENLFMSISTREPQVFKSVSKTLYKYFTDSTFMINSQGIYIQEGKEDMSVLFESFFRKELFDKFIIPKFKFIVYFFFFAFLYISIAFLLLFQ